MEIAKKKIDLDSLRLEDVIDIEVLQRFQDDFAKGMGPGQCNRRSKWRSSDSAERVYEFLFRLYAQHGSRGQTLCKIA